MGSPILPPTLELSQELEPLPDAEHDVGDRWGDGADADTAMNEAEVDEYVAHEYHQQYIDVDDVDWGSDTEDYREEVAQEALAADDETLPTGGVTDKVEENDDREALETAVRQSHPSPPRSNTSSAKAMDSDRPPSRASEVDKYRRHGSHGNEHKATNKERESSRISRQSLGRGQDDDGKSANGKRDFVRKPRSPGRYQAERREERHRKVDERLAYNREERPGYGDDRRGAPERRPVRHDGYPPRRESERNILLRKGPLAQLAPDLRGVRDVRDVRDARPDPGIVGIGSNSLGLAALLAGRDGLANPLTALYYQAALGQLAAAQYSPSVVAAVSQKYSAPSGRGSLSRPRNLARPRDAYPSHRDSHVYKPDVTRGRSSDRVRNYDMADTAFRGREHATRGRSRDWERNSDKADVASHKADDTRGRSGDRERNSDKADAASQRTDVIRARSRDREARSSVKGSEVSSSHRTSPSDKNADKPDKTRSSNEDRPSQFERDVDSRGNRARRDTGNPGAHRSNSQEGAPAKVRDTDRPDESRSRDGQSLHRQPPARAHQQSLPSNASRYSQSDRRDDSQPCDQFPGGPMRDWKRDQRGWEDDMGRPRGGGRGRHGNNHSYNTPIGPRPSWPLHAPGAGDADFYSRAPKYLPPMMDPFPRGVGMATQPRLPPVLRHQTASIDELFSEHLGDGAWGRRDGRGGRRGSGGR